MTQLPLAEHYHKFLFREALFPILEKLSESWHHLLRWVFWFRFVLVFLIILLFLVYFVVSSYLTEKELSFL